MVEWRAGKDKEGGGGSEGTDRTSVKQVCYCGVEVAICKASRTFEELMERENVEIVGKCRPSYLRTNHTPPLHHKSAFKSTSQKWEPHTSPPPV